MSDLVDWLFTSSGFMPHGHCYLWQPGTLWLNVGSDGLIAAAYFAIPVSLYEFVRRRISELPFPAIAARRPARCVANYPRCHRAQTLGSVGESAILARPP
jgi:hypothetical protein